jgi:hypothetical protein
MWPWIPAFAGMTEVKMVECFRSLVRMIPIHRENEFFSFQLPPGAIDTRRR